MPDLADMAQEKEERMMEAHRNAAARTSAPRPTRGPAFCRCGEEMPTVRREYGCQDCIECAEIRERKERGY